MSLRKIIFFALLTVIFLLAHSVARLIRRGYYDFMEIFTMKFIVIDILFLLLISLGIVFFKKRDN
jgi:pilus assembly protein TadC